MRFAVAHKTSTYLMVGFAYLAMIVGGGVSGPLAMGGLLALVASWWWEPPLVRTEKWAVLWTIGSLLALAYTVLTAIATGDFLGVGAQFLVWLIVAKAFNRRTARDWQQMYLLAFLMLVAGSVLNPDLTYGLCFLGFVITSTWALTLFHLRREMEDNFLVKHAADRAPERVEVRRILDSRRIVGARFFAGTGALSFGVFLGAAIVFLALPRVGIGFFLKGHNGMTFAGFSDGVKLGGHGLIKNDSRVVMRVEIEGRYGNRDAPEIHWRGVAFDHYQNGEWMRTNGAPLTDATVDDEGRRVTDRRMLWYGERRSRTELEAQIPQLAQQEVWLEPLDSDVLFAAGKPRIVEYQHVVRPRASWPERNDEIRLVHGSTVHYTVWSDLRTPSASVLRAATGDLPKNYGVYLQLPKEITPRTRELARTITAGAKTEYDKAVAIRDWLAKNLSYTLELKEPGAQEPVDFFLFDRKMGHCEYFASAFAVLARAVGVPTRNVNGFLGGEWNEYQGYVAVRAGDAHSWDEVYFPSVGWVTFDPTPAADVDELGRGGSGWTSRLGRLADTLKFQWNKWVIEYDLASQLALFKSIGAAIGDAVSAVKRAILAAKDWALEHVILSAAILLALAGAIALWRRRRKRPAGWKRGAEKSRPRTRVAQIYDGIARALAKSGTVRATAVTPRELAALLRHRGAVASAQIAELTELYYEAEWGRRDDPAAEARATALADEIRTALAAAPR